MKTDMAKVAILGNSAESVLNFRGPLMVEMVRRGHEVLAFAPDYDDAARSWLTSRGITPINYGLSRAGMNPLREAFSVFEIWRLLLRHQPDITLTYFIKPVIYGSLAAWIARVPCRYAMIEGLGYAFTEGNSASRSRALTRNIVTMLFRGALSRVTRVIFLNSDDREEFVSRRLMDPEKAEVLGGVGVDLGEWPHTPIPTDQPVSFLLVGRLLRDKGIEEFVSAARELRASYRDARFVLLGGVDSNPTAISVNDVRGWVDEGIIEWPGHVDVKPWLAQSHVFVLPSYREGVPRSTQEAMAFGRPVVTTDVPGCRETVVENLNGYLVPARSPRALAEAMSKFLKNPDMIASMGRESRRIAEQRYDVRVQNQRLLEMMDL